MEEKTKDKSLEQRTEEITEAKIGKDPAKDEKVEPESALDEMRRTNREMSETLKGFTEIAKSINVEAANIALAGRAVAGQVPQEKTQEDIDQEAANAIVASRK